MKVAALKPPLPVIPLTVLPLSEVVLVLPTLTVRMLPTLTVNMLDVVVFCHVRVVRVRCSLL